MATQRGLLTFLAGLAFVVSCSVGKLLDAPPQKVIGVTPPRVVDSMAEGSPRDTAALGIETTGGGAPRPWSAISAAEASWLRLLTATGTTPGTLEYSLDPSGLASGGIYRDTIVIVPTDPGVAQVRVPVELLVLPAVSRLEFVQQPTTTSAGTAITPAIEVRALDSNGQPFTGFSGTVTIALGAHPTSATLSGIPTASASGGIARFPGLSLDKAGTYTLTATASGLTGATSASFDITPGLASQLRFKVQPSTTSPNRAIAPPVEVWALDDAGNVATAFTGTVTVAIGNDGSPLKNAQLSGGTAAAAAGVASFDNLTIDQVGIGYTLKVTSGSLRDAISQQFDVSAVAPPPPPPPPPATHLGFVTQPGPVEVNQTMTAVRVEALDATGTRVAGFTGAIDIALSPNPGVLAGNTSATASGGEASFTGLRVTEPGSYTLIATFPGLTEARSLTFNVTPPPPPPPPPPPNQPPTASFPVPSCSGLTCSFTSTSSDPDGTISSYNWTFGDGASSSQQNPSRTYAAGGSYTVTLQVTDNQGANSTVFSRTVTVTAPPPPPPPPPPPATRVEFTRDPPPSLVLNATFSVEVTARDANGNTATTFSGPVTITLQGPIAVGGSLQGNRTVNAINGIATFGNLSVTGLCVGCSLNASAPGLQGATSSSFSVILGLP